MTFGDALAYGRSRLHAGEPRDALRLLEHVTGRSYAWLVAHGDELLDHSARARYEAVLDRRATGEPVAYIAGEAGFYGRRFAVTRDVLVPRPETEELLERALAAVRTYAAVGPGEPIRICDVGTGSGVLAISLALELDAVSVLAVDVSAEALAVARRNAEEHGVADRVRFALGDALDAFSAEAPFAAIVANLPYVRSGDLQAAPDPTAFEPRLALDGGADGLALYRRLLARAPALLAPGGTLLMEAGPDTAGPLAAASAVAFGEAAEVALHGDYGGRERIVEVHRRVDAKAPRP
jgi:release factor glutamine methyltransferase